MSNIQAFLGFIGILAVLSFVGGIIEMKFFPTRTAQAQ
jgi:multisubunit Na+/H+ antiporter MnhF subunit